MTICGVSTPSECCGFECDWKQFPDKEKQSVFFRNYLAASTGREDKAVKQDELDQLYLEVQPYVLAAHFFWGTWAVLQVSRCASQCSSPSAAFALRSCSLTVDVAWSVQARYSPIEFDYMVQAHSLCCCVLGL